MGGNHLTGLNVSIWVLLSVIMEDDSVIGIAHALSKDWVENRMGNKILKALSGHLEDKVQSIQLVSLKELSSV